MFENSTTRRDALKEVWVEERVEKYRDEVEAMESEIASSPKQVRKVEWDYYMGKIQTPGIVETIKEKFDALQAQSYVDKTEVDAIRHEHLNSEEFHAHDWEITANGQL